MLITEEYRELNRELHRTKESYGVSGAKYALRIEEIAGEIGAVSILDYGCGKQMLGKALCHLLIKGYDPAVEGLEDTPEPADLVVCGDVLEHIEPDCLEAVLDDLKRCALTAIFFTVCMVPAKKHLADGRNAHLIVKPMEWWLPKIMQRWDLRALHAGESANFPVMGEFAAFATKKLVAGNGEAK